MGVIKNRIRSSGCSDHYEEVNVEDLIALPHHNNQEADDGQNQEEQALLRQERNRIRRLQKQSRRVPVRPEPTFRSLGCKGKSYKKYRRYENANLLGQGSLNSDPYMDSDTLFNDISIHDFVSESVSPFAQMLRDEGMKLLSAFMEVSEEEQQAFFMTNKPTNETEEWKKGIKRSIDEEDKRANNPSFSPEESFQKLNVDVKNMLKKRHVPLGLLAAIEEELLAFFMDDPMAVYKNCLPSGFQRLLLHACCQYSDLRCNSFNKKDDGKRWSKVHNPNSSFQPPSVLLSRYLEQQ